MASGSAPAIPICSPSRRPRSSRRRPSSPIFAKAGRRGNARAIVDCWLKSSHVELPLYYPMTNETHFDDPPYRDALARFYKECTVAIASHLEAGRDVALLSEGDPMLYGSFMHLFIRLRDNFDVSIVPGVSSICGAWGVAAAPMTWGDDALVVLPATLPLDRAQAPACARRRRGDHEDRPQFRAREGGARRDGHGGARHLCRARDDGGRGRDAAVSRSRMIPRPISRSFSRRGGGGGRERARHDCRARSRPGRMDDAGSERGDRGGERHRRLRPVCGAARLAAGPTRPCERQSG